MLDKPTAEVRERSETRDRMAIDWDMPITINDGGRTTESYLLLPIIPPKS